MDVRIGGVVTLLVATVAGGAARAQTLPGVRVEHAAARLEVVAEPRANVSVTISHGPSALPPLTVRRQGSVIVVDGGLGRPLGGDRLRCVGGISHHAAGHFFGMPVTHVRDDRAVVVEGVGRVDYSELPVVTAHVPMNTQVGGAGAVWGRIDATDHLELTSSGSGDWRLGPVKGGLSAETTGSGDVRVDSTGPLHVKLAGSGDVDAGPVAGPADLSVAGSGDVRTGPVAGPLRAALAGSGGIDVAQVNGPIDGHVASSGDVHIHGGASPAIYVNLAGSGDFIFDGVVDKLAATVVGSGDVRIGRVTGPVSKSVMGSGDVTFGH